MKNKFLSALIISTLAILVFGMVSASAATEGIYTYSVSDGKATITDCSSSASGAIVIPSTLGGYPVTAIGERAFYYCRSLTSITIPDSVTSIEYCAFSSCSSLTSITIPDSVTSIGTGAFSNCTSLTSITIPNSVTSIGDDAFPYCSSLTSIIVDDNNTYYSSDSYGVLYNKDKTKLIQYPIGNSRTSFTIPNSITSIGYCAFSNCNSLTSITIPDSVTSIGDYTFYSCNSLESITIPDSVTSIGDSAFSGCRSLTSIEIPDNVTAIGNNAFSSCTSLTSIEIPDSVTSIGTGAFSGCESLTNITIPDSVTSIGERAFSSCHSLTSITIPDSVTTISERAFTSCTNLSSIVIPNSVTSIGDYAFYDCTCLTSIQIPDSVTSIGDYAFSDCYSITSITIPNSVTSIGDRAFYDCYSITSITIPNSVTSIGNNAFECCFSLTSITIPDSVTSIGNSTFSGCESLTNITIPNSVTSIGERAFSFCYSLTSITIPNSVTSIGNYAFFFCDSLTTVYYNGRPEEWDSMTIGSDNGYLENAERKYFYYVTLLDGDGTEISKMMNMGEPVDLSAVVVPNGHKAVLYTDKELTEEFDISTTVSENLTLYVVFESLNPIKFTGATAAEVGECGITQKVVFATEWEAKYLSLTLKVPNDLTIQEIKSDIFEIEQDSEVIGNDTYFYLFGLYNGDGNIPTKQEITAFELVFDVSENAVADKVLTIEILDDAILADEKGNNYIFTTVENTKIKITPVLAKEITIIGADEIESPTTYTVAILPENTANKEVEWSVSDETVATISADGVLTPVSNGTVTIKATAKDGSGVFAEKTVTVKTLATVPSISSNIGIWDSEYTPIDNSYVIYVPNLTTSIKFTAKHPGTLKTADGKTTFANNIARTVILSSNETVLTLNYTCDGYANNTYTITILKFEGTKTNVSEDKKSFTVNPVNIENGKTVILALYNGEKFVELQPAIYDGEAIHFTTTASYTDAKVMVWNDLTNLKPVCSAEMVKL